MTYIEAALLALIQGLTEFLPVSSSGHLVIVQKLLGFKEHNLTYDLVLHVGSLIAIFIVYRKTVKQIILDLIADPLVKKNTAGAKVFWMTFIASVPTAIIGLSFKDTFEAFFDSIHAVGYFLLVTSSLLYISYQIDKKRNSNKSVASENKMLAFEEGLKNASSLNWKKALVIGIVQGMAILPGISRAGSTIASAMILNIPRTTAAMFSFCLATPAILGAALLQARDVNWAQFEWGINAFGLLMSVLFSYIGLNLLLKVVGKGRIDYFSYYLVPVALFCIFY